MSFDTDTSLEINIFSDLLSTDPGSKDKNS